MHGDRLAKLLAGVEDMVVEGIDYNEVSQEVIIKARATAWHSCECGRCGRKAPVYDAGQGRRRWRCVDAGPWKCYIEADAFRVACPECGVTVRRVPWAAHGSWFTYSFEETVCWLALSMSKTACKKLMRIEWRTVGDICKRVVDRLEGKRPPILDGLVRIGVDETSYEKGHKYMTVVVNHDTGAVVWCEKGHGRKVFDSFFEKLTPDQRRCIELVSGDGARWIDECIGEWCPGAVRCVDTFHVVSWATDVLDEVRKQAWRKAADTAKAAPKRGRGRPRKDEAANPERKAAAQVKGLRYPLLKNPEDLTERQAAALELTALSNPKLYRAYLLKEGLRLALKLPADQIKEALEEWRGRAWRSRIPEFVELQRKVKRHMDAIVATAEYGITNARVEAVNNKIKLTIKMAYGFRNFENLQAMVMLRCSGLPIELPGRASKAA